MDATTRPGKGHGKSTHYVNEFTRPLGRQRRKRTPQKWASVDEQIAAFRRGEIGYVELPLAVPDDG